jgi:hypothetical protein
VSAEAAPTVSDGSRDTLLLYCPYDRKVTRHSRRGPDNTIVCVECGRRLEVTHTQRTAQVVPLARPQPGPYNGSRVRRIGAARSRLPFLLVAVMTSGALFALMTTFGVTANPFASPASERPAIAAAPDTAGVSVQEAPPAAEAPGSPAAPPAQADAQIKVANTGGTGVYLRKTPNLGDRVRAWADGTALKVVGPDTVENGVTWKHVQDPAGNDGWIPAQYTAPTS